MLARAACRILSLFCAMLCIIVGVHAGKGEEQGNFAGGGKGSAERRRITDTLLLTVARGGYPPMHAIRVRMDGGCIKKKASGPTVDAGRRFAVGKQ